MTNPIKEAALAMHVAEEAHHGLRLRMDVSHKFVHVTADLGEQQLSRSVSWDVIEGAMLGVPLTTAISTMVRELVPTEVA